MKSVKISVSAEQYDSLKSYSEAFEIPFDEVVAEALGQFIECCVNVRLESLAESLSGQSAMSDESLDGLEDVLSDGPLDPTLN